MPYPTASDLIFSEQANHNFSKTLGELKRSTLSIQNRLLSIQQDAIFAGRVADAYGRPVIANERCGSWYIDPQHKAGSAYFKSTDGHTGVWKFSTRRLNLHLLKVIGENDGCIIIDSTRRGKRMPDALSKTIPIWCSVLNQLLFPELAQDPTVHQIYTPPQAVSISEHAQIAALLPTFLSSLQALNLSVESLKSQISKPLRPIWITPDSYLGSIDSVFEFFHPIICCTVSRRVEGGEMSEGGYIQGAGDDTENWAHGLTPPIFWANHEAMLSTPERELPELIEVLIQKAASSGNVGEGMRCVRPTSNVIVCSLQAITEENASNGGCTISLLPKITDESTWQASTTRLDIGLGPHKLGSRNLRIALPKIVAFVHKILYEAGSGNRMENKRLLLACESGKDLSIGTALALLCLFFDEHGIVLNDQIERSKIDKTFIRRRLGWISASMPDANPSRATLQSVNSFLMERP